MKAMILAAGRGERMRPLTDAMPKPLLPVAGKPLLQYHVEALLRAGIRDIVINLAWKGAMIREALGDGAALGANIVYSDEGDAALETGGGIFKALNLLGSGPFVVVSGDIWTGYSFENADTRLADADVAHFVMVPNPDFHERGDFGLSSGRMTNDGERHTYANIGWFRPEFFQDCKPGRFPLAPLMVDWIAKKRISGEIYVGAWKNLGTPTQLSELDAQLRASQR